MTNQHLRARVKKLLALAEARSPDIGSFLAAVERDTELVTRAFIRGDIPVQHDAKDVELIDTYAHKYGVDIEDDSREYAKIMGFIDHGPPS